MACLFLLPALQPYEGSCRHQQSSPPSESNPCVHAEAYGRFDFEMEEDNCIKAQQRRMLDDVLLAYGQGPMVLKEAKQSVYAVHGNTPAIEHCDYKNETASKCRIVFEFQCLSNERAVYIAYRISVKPMPLCLLFQI